MNNHDNTVAVIFALLSSLTIAVGTVWRHRILRAGLSHSEANQNPLVSLRHPQWWMSIGLAFAAYGFQAAALAFGSLLVVQPILILSLMFTLVLAAWMDHRRMAVDEGFWAIVLTASVGAVIILGRPIPGTRVPSTWEWVGLIGGGLVLCAITSAIASRRPPSTQALLYGIVCGVVFGYLAVFSKVAVDAFTSGGIPALLTTWQFWAMIACSLMGTLVQQYAFGAGVLSRSLPAMKIFEPLVALFIGFTILGEDFMITSALSWTVLVGAVVMMMVATGMLSHRSVL